VKKELQAYFSDRNGFYVEIGPLNNPQLTKDEYPNLKYADIRNTDDVYEFFGRFSPVVKSRADIVEIDYVVGGSYREVIGKNEVDAFFSSHVIEHTPDLLRHFIEIADCLKDGGVYVMTVPSKDGYAYDKFRAVTSLRDAIDVHKNGVKALSRFVFDARIATMYMGKSQSDSAGFHVPALGNARIAVANYDESVAIGRPHYWVFTLISFLELIRDGILCGLLPYSLEHYSDKSSRDSFDVVLRKSHYAEENQDACSKEVMRIQHEIDCLRGNSTASLIDFCKGKKLLIYGAGELGRGFYHYAKYHGVDAAAFVVSDGQDKVDSLFGLPVMFLSEILPRKDEYLFAVAFNGNDLVAENLVRLGCDFIKYM
jgi:SAM-dependent methyltransferase